jgi:hypothetical protein
MIRVRYTCQASLPGYRIVYTWQGRVLTATLYRGEEEVGREIYDLSALQPGDEVVEVELEALTFSPLVFARCLENGTLEATLLYWYDGGKEPELAEEVLDG